MTDILDIRRYVFHLDGTGPIAGSARTPALWSDPGRPELATGQLLSVFEYEQTWDYRERHPAGDELAIVLAGAVALLLDAGDGERGVAVAAGEAAVIPAGVWHRVATHEPATVLFVTPVPARTEHEPLG
jgi:quercetin dioxygenase-like cupin family protein